MSRPGGLNNLEGKNPMSKLISISSLTACALALSAPGAYGAITSVSGMTQLISPPGACGPGQLAGFDAHAWNEKQGVALNLSVDMVNNPGTSSSPVAGTVNGVYDSHFIHYENIPGVVSAAGTVVFSQPIVAVIFTASLLDVSDSPAGSPSTIYPTTYPFRGIATTPPSTFSINVNTLTFNFNTFSPATELVQVRVLTLVPAPGAGVALMGAGLLGLGRRRRPSADCARGM